MKVLIPMLSGEEGNAEFMKRATKGAKEIVLQLVVDATGTNKFGFAASEIAHGNELMEGIKSKLQGKTVDTVLEWGETERKIENLAKLQRVDKVVMVKQDNQYFKNLVKSLKEANIPVEVV